MVGSDHAVITMIQANRNFGPQACGDGGDDGTRTHDPLLANTPEVDGGGWWRTISPDQIGFVDGGEWQRTVADVR